jgi:2-C-methyl-D-erythritol 4-phosphate cytidylyltransferase
MVQQLLVSVIIVAGGIGTRMKSSTPKQFLMMRGRAIARHSFDLFLSLPYIAEIVVVCDPAYQTIFDVSHSVIPIAFASPGERRQDSVFNGFQKLSQQLSRTDTLVCIHDSARPLVTAAVVDRVVEAARVHGAAIAGVPLKATVKVCDDNQMVVSTPNRSALWEVQTPQVIRYNLMKEGLDRAHRSGVAVTDDASLIELLGYPVKIVEAAYTNIKVTTPDDLVLAERFLDYV